MIPTKEQKENMKKLPCGMYLIDGKEYMGVLVSDNYATWKTEKIKGRTFDKDSIKEEKKDIDRKILNLQEEIKHLKKKKKKLIYKQTPVTKKAFEKYFYEIKKDIEDSDDKIWRGREKAL
jgi:hypothetical protein